MTNGNGGPRGLGGWLILPAIGLVFSPFRMLAYVGREIFPIFQDGGWEFLTTPGMEMYHPLWAPLIIFELLGNLFFAGFSGALIYLFFTKSHRFPTLMIVYLLSNLGFIVLDSRMAQFIPFTAEDYDAEIYKEIARGVVGAMIWVPYFLVSKRVKNTFVRRDPDPVVLEAFD